MRQGGDGPDQQDGLDEQLIRDYEGRQTGGGIGGDNQQAGEAKPGDDVALFLEEIADQDRQHQTGGGGHGGEQTNLEVAGAQAG